MMVIGEIFKEIIQLGRNHDHGVLMSKFSSYEREEVE